MKKVLKIFLYTFLAIIILLTAAGVSLYLFQDRIISSFVEAANQRLNTPVRIGKIKVRAWDDFPRLSLVFLDVYVEDSFPEKGPLLEADRIAFSLDPLEMWRGQYSVRSLEVTGALAQLKVNSRGMVNYDIMKPSTGTGSQVSFDLRGVGLHDIRFSFDNQRTQQYHVFASDHLKASLTVEGARYDIETDGLITSHQIGIGGQRLLENKTVEVHTSLAYFDDEKKLIIHPSNLFVHRSRFEASGTYRLDDPAALDLKIEGKDTDLQTLLSLMPEEIAQHFRKYQSEGEVYFGLVLKGEWNEKRTPELAIRFGCRQARLFHPESHWQLENLTLEGTFTTPTLRHGRESRLTLRNIEGLLNGEKFAGHFAVRNLTDPSVDASFKGRIEVGGLYALLPSTDLEAVQGHVLADVSLTGDINKLKKKTTAQQVRTAGTLQLESVSFALRKHPVAVGPLTGTLQFNNNDLALSNVKGRVGQSDFLINGFFKNIITYLLFDQQPLGIEADLQSDFLNVDELMGWGFSDPGGGSFAFRISPLLYLNFNCDIAKLTYKRFAGRRLKGDLLVRNQVAQSRSIAVQAMGGGLTFSGSVDATHPGALDLTGRWQLTQVHLDSIFYTFENFYQNFIEQKHLRGQVTADVMWQLALTEQLALKPETLVADIQATIRNGELNNFEPLKALNRYLDDDGLARLRFADLQNDIHIENRTIYIPQMEVRTNVTNLLLSGTHTFDQRIDYRISAPLRNKKKIDPDEAFGALEEEKGGQTKVFLKITGTTDRYEVAYDREAVKRKISADLKKEVKELKDAFRLKGQKKKKVLELTTEEFDWEQP